FGDKATNDKFNAALHEVAEDVSLKPLGVASSQDLLIHTEDNVNIGSDQYHFNMRQMRTLGNRFAQALIDAPLAASVYSSVSGPGKVSHTAYTGLEQSIVFTLTPNAGYNKLKSFKINDADVTAQVVSYTYTVVNPSGDYTAEAVFEAKAALRFTYEYDKTMGGYDGSKTSSTVREGEAVKVYPAPLDGFKTVKVAFGEAELVLDESQGCYVLLNAATDGVITITFEKIAANPDSDAWKTILLIAGGGVVIIGAAVSAVILLRRKKKKR
ncbi:MAG: hypothetical protein LBS99_03740, partial [Clostridiales bacterium]|nr:hypothetical protein [Clostridiales bacterium]